MRPPLNTLLREIDNVPHYQRKPKRSTTSPKADCLFPFRPEKEKNNKEILKILLILSEISLQSCPITKTVKPVPKIHLKG